MFSAKLISISTKLAASSSKSYLRQPITNANLLLKQVSLARPQQLRFYADNKKDEYKSILNDDLLEKAGLNTDAAKEEAAASAQESANESQSKQSGDDLYEDQPRRKRANKSSSDKKKELYAKLFYLSLLGSGFVGGVYLCRDWDKEDEPDLYVESENGYTPGKMWSRFSKRYTSLTGVFSEPAYNDLLPPPLPEQYRPPLTLVLELDDLLVHSEWSQKKGWRTAKRMGVDYFLGYLSQYYEIVIFSKGSMAFSENTVSKLDPYHAFIVYSLFREACRTVDGKIVKDLSLMNRDLGKLIIIDPDQDCYSMQPENAIPMDKWEGGKDDRLVKLIPFLEYLAVQQVKDVRPVLASFKDKKNIPEEFAEREKKLREKFEQDQANNGASLMGSLLGSPSSLRQKKMPLDTIREAGQRNYAALVTYLKENGDKFLEEEKQKTKEMFADQKITLGKIVTEGMPNAEDIAKQQAAAAAQGNNK